MHTHTHTREHWHGDYTMGDGEQRETCNFLTRSHRSALEMCNLSWTPHSSLEKDNSLNHSCVSPKMGVYITKN